MHANLIPHTRHQRKKVYIKSKQVVTKNILYIQLVVGLQN